MQCEAQENWFIVDNAATMGTYTLGFKPAGGTATGLQAGSKHLLYTDGSTMFNVLDDMGDVTVNGTLDVAGNVSFDGGTFVFNNSQEDFDFRIEGNSDANLFFTDAGNDRIGIKTGSPSTELHVVGGVKATGNIDFDGGTFTFNDSHGDFDFRIEGDADSHLFFTNADNDRVGIGVSSPAAKMEIDQSSTTGAIPVLNLDQGDVDQPFVDFVGTSAADDSSSISSSTATASDKFGAVMVKINGTAKWIRIYDDPT